MYIHVKRERPLVFLGKKRKEEKARKEKTYKERYLKMESRLFLQIGAVQRKSQRDRHLLLFKWKANIIYLSKYSYLK